MKKNLLLVFALFIGLVFTSCSKDDNDPIQVSLNLNKFDLSKGLPTAGGKYWEGTFKENTVLKSGIFTISHTATPAHQIWNGFTVSNSTDSTNYKTNFDSWIKNQWGCMAQKGSTGNNYLVGYWSSYADSVSITEKFGENKFSNWIKIEDGVEKYRTISVDISNSPWAYHNITEAKFKDGDYFKLKVYGVNEDNVISEKVIEHYLADYRNGKKYLPKNWNKVDLRALGAVKYIMLQMETTDLFGTYPNTPTYFCLDNLVVEIIK